MRLHSKTLSRERQPNKAVYVDKLYTLPSRATGDAFDACSQGSSCSKFFGGMSGIALSSSGRSQPLISWVFTGACWVIVGAGRSETLRSNSSHCCPERAPYKLRCRLITHAQTTDVFLTPNNLPPCLRHSHFFIRQTPAKPGVRR